MTDGYRFLGRFVPRDKLYMPPPNFLWNLCLCITAYNPNKRSQRITRGCLNTDIVFQFYFENRLPDAELKLCPLWEQVPTPILSRGRPVSAPLVFALRILWFVPFTFVVVSESLCHFQLQAGIFHRKIN